MKHTKNVPSTQATMVNQQPIFHDKWLAITRTNSDSASWANEVIWTLDTTGQIYLSTLRFWFHEFPLNLKQKQHLRNRLESLKNEQHLGGVNELAWWAFMRHESLTAIPLPATKAPCPDFQLQPPADCFVEVSTLNVSDKDKAKFEAGESVALDHVETFKRLIRKLTDEKQKQLKYAADREKPCVLALFDYTEWSAFGTLFFRTLGEFLLGSQFGFKELPLELSAIVYLERRVLDGRIALRRDRSAVYYNPLALHPLSLDSFPSLNQFSSQLVSADPRSTEHWIWL